jgi:hypothetical protein
MACSYPGRFIALQKSLISTLLPISLLIAANRTISENIPYRLGQALEEYAAAEECEAVKTAPSGVLGKESNVDTRVEDVEGEIFAEATAAGTRWDRSVGCSS